VPFVLLTNSSYFPIPLLLPEILLYLGYFTVYIKTHFVWRTLARNSRVFKAMAEEDQDGGVGVGVAASFL